MILPLPVIVAAMNTLASQSAQMPSRDFATLAADEVVNLRADWAGSADATSYRVGCWTSNPLTPTNSIETENEYVSFSVTNLFDDRVFATVTAIRYGLETPGPNIAHWPPYPADRLVISAPVYPFTLETSINLKQWSFCTNAVGPVTFLFAGSRRYYRGTNITAKPHNPLND